ncbi:site-specific integrase [Shewanella psychromarinicola]|uniref:Site-specific integrase n=1 Tax=Shewanella psychromarinicola TaxID=2487742 RepID=A0A3N4E1P1_9GAMM|nr:site-specific integrase [Shewanella psychromarinicola]AZG34586.1 site-specific integrase [Shewanella psychromarinicola]MCL1081735.1 tyrosine-type recombinase/integrase [Shewanella psychromarinicola]RPA28161.1 site-specific integrase [Shewanella psychromarinicola]
MLSKNVELQSTPTTTIASSGFEFDYLDDVWILNRNVTVNVSFLVQFNDRLAEDVIDTLVHYAENHSAHHVSNLAKSLKLYLMASDTDSFSEHGFLAFKSSLSKKNQYKLSIVRGFLRQMRYLGFDENIDDNVYKLTDRWTIPGNEKGVAVLSLDPEVGPFSSAEFEAIGLNAAHKFAEGQLTTKQYATLQLFKATGRRPEQIALLKVKDFSLTSQYTGTPTYVVQVPRVKQGGFGFRSRFRTFGLINSVGQVIELYIEEGIAAVEYQLDRKLTPAEINELPLFMSDKTIKSLNLFSNADLLQFFKTELSHITSAGLARLLISATNKLRIVSERTGQFIHINPYRFRYTLGTRAAIEGAGILTIATLLDHSDTQNVNVYVANLPEFAIEISKIMNQPLAQYAAAFAGKLVEDEREANRINVGATRIPLREKDCDLGSCGTNAFCQDYAPIACYLCPKFMPWANAPHHLILEWLIEERNRLKDDTDGDMTIVSINDQVIVAVCQVIQLCKDYNNV